MKVADVNPVEVVRPRKSKVGAVSYDEIAALADPADVEIVTSIG